MNPKYKNMLKYKKLFIETYLSKIYRYENKIIKRVDIGNKNYKKEFNILNGLNIQNVINIEDSFYNNKHFYMIMEHYQRGDLQYQIRKKYIIKKDIDIIKNKLLKPVCSIHNVGIVHLDIKPSNYLLNYLDNNYTLIDFNLAEINHKGYYELVKLNNIVGTKGYTAPEIKNGYYCKSSDIYSIGCILFNISNPNIKYNTNINLDEFFSEDENKIKNLISDCLQYDPKLRPSVFDLNYYY